MRILLISTKEFDESSIDRYIDKIIALKSSIWNNSKKRAILASSHVNFKLAWSKVILKSSFLKMLRNSSHICDSKEKMFEIDILYFFEAIKNCERWEIEKFLILVFAFSFLWKGFLFILYGMVFHSVLDVIYLSYEGRLDCREFSYIRYLVLKKKYPDKYFQ